MKATQLLSNVGQSIWLDNITRDLLDTDTLKSYIAELSLTGLTSNPTIFEHAIKNSSSDDAPLREKIGDNRSCEEGAKSFVKSWNALMDVIASKSAVLKKPN